MPLPEPFSDVEHLQLVIRRYLNKQIREDFRDLFGDNENWEPEVGTTLLEVDVVFVFLTILAIGNYGCCALRSKS